MKKLLLATALVLAVGLQAKADPLVSVTTTDDIYGPFSGSIAQGATGGAATLSWRSAGFGWSGSIGLTEAGLVVADIQTSGDNYELFAPGSGDLSIGGACTATECVAITNDVPASMYSAIAAANGGQGICCGGSSLFVTVDAPADVPEPATMAIFGTGFLAMRAARRFPANRGATASAIHAGQLSCG
jgi:PEP-CTERM motif